MNTIFRALITGIRATIATDCWSLTLRLLGVKSKDLFIVEGWISTHILQVYFSIDQTWVIGWTTHYLIAIFFSFLFILFLKKKWVQKTKSLNSLIYSTTPFSFSLFIAWPIIGYVFAFLPTNNIHNMLIFKRMSPNLMITLSSTYTESIRRNFPN